MSFDPQGTVAAAFGNRPADELGEFFRKLRIAATAHDMPADAVVLAEELLGLSRYLSDADRRALAFAFLASFLSVGQGSSRLPVSGGPGGHLGDLVTSIARAGRIECNINTVLRDIRRLANETAFDHLIGGPTENRPLIFDDDCLYQQRLHYYEVAVCDALSPRLGASTFDPADICEAVADVAASPTVLAGRQVELSEEQIAAAGSALSRRFALISGGPGTGKTAIAVALLRAATRLGVSASRMGLAAPTGKAAHRLGQSVRSQLEAIAAPAQADRELTDSLAEPSTLHRFLGYSAHTGRFRYHHNNPLPLDLVVIDEGSMIDLVLAERLLTALPKSCALIILGDAEQLPSVDAGAVLRDLVLFGAAQPETDQFGFRLTRNFRVDAGDEAGRQILECAAAVNAGDNGRLRAAMTQRRRVQSLSFRGAELVPGADPASVARFALAWHRRCVASEPDYHQLSRRVYTDADLEAASGGDGGRDIDRLYRTFSKYRLLCVTRRLHSGTEAINDTLHQVTIADAGATVQSGFYPGEPVIVRRNDYRRGLLNGDQGVVIRYRAEGADDHHFAVAFPDGAGFRAISIDALRGNCELGYAMTVHRSQGSEWDDVALILPAVDMPLLDRQLLYTAITRARRSAVVVGAQPLLKAAVNRSIKRFSGIANRLA